MRIRAGPSLAGKRAGRGVAAAIGVLAVIGGGATASALAMIGGGARATAQGLEGERQAVGATRESIERGRRLSYKYCAFCHVIGDFNRFGGIGSTPSFQLLASMRDGAERFATFHVRRPHPSFLFLPGQRPPTDLPLAVPAVKLTLEDIADIAAFAMTLYDARLAE